MAEQPKFVLMDGDFYFCVACKRCQNLIPLFHDPSRGVKNINFEGAGKLEARCGSCGKFAKYPVTALTLVQWGKKPN